MSPARANDLELYEREARSWWDPRSKAFRSLRSIEEARARRLAGTWGERLRGARVIDLGCGGGFLAAPLAACGARVIGLDLSGASLRVALDHAAATFVRADLRRAPLVSGCADFVLLADVVEHLERPEEALLEAARLLRPGGELLVSTLNATLRARLFAVWLAENLGLVPRGTHDARLFVAPERLSRLAAESGLTLIEYWGESVRLGRTIARWTIELAPSNDLSVSYCARFAVRGRA